MMKTHGTANARYRIQLSYGLLGVMHVVTSHLELTRLLSIWIVLLGNIVPTSICFSTLHFNAGGPVR